MAIEYKASGNNINLLMGEGNFGNRLIREPAAPRYIKAKFNKINDKLFLDNDILLENSDPEAEEPEFYLPLIPILLVNEQQGISMGFSTYVPPHNPVDIIDYIMEFLEKGESDVKIEPYWRHINYKLEYIEADSKYRIYGNFERKGKSGIVITELPPRYDRAKYLAILNSLQEKGYISSYIDDSTGNDFNFNVRLVSYLSDEEIVKKFKLSNYVNYNIVAIRDNNVVEYENCYDVATDFLEIRLSYYIKRYEKLIADLEEDNRFLKAKIEFIENVIDFMGKNKGKITKKQMVGFIKIEEFKERLIRIPIYDFTVEKIKELKARIKDNLMNIEIYRNVDIKNQYILDLAELKKALISSPGY